MLAIVKIRFADYIDAGFFLDETGREMAAVAFELEFELFLIRKLASDAKLKIVKKYFSKYPNPNPNPRIL